MEEKPFELFCTENDFAKYFEKFWNLLFEHFISHIMIISQNDAFIYYHRANQISLYYIILQNPFLAPE